MTASEDAKEPSMRAHANGPGTHHRHDVMTYDDPTPHPYGGGNDAKGKALKPLSLTLWNKRQTTPSGEQHTVWVWYALTIIGNVAAW